MAHTNDDASFFEELEAATKRLSVASATNQSIVDLKMLFDELKDSMGRTDYDASEVRGYAEP